MTGKYRGQSYIFASVSLFIFLLLASQAALSQSQPTKLVSTAWLAENLNNANLRIIDMRSDIRDYWQVHIPGAVHLDSSILRWPENGVPSKLIQPESLTMLLGWMGISENTMVIVYYDKNGYPPFYLIWALDYIGHKNSALLEDGIEKWRQEGRPLTQDYPQIKPLTYRWSGKLHAEVRATIEQVKKEIKGGAVLIDVRPADLYNGEKGKWKRKGHIKGAINHFWASDMLGNGSWKSRDDLLTDYEKQGVTPERAIIVYCGQGQMAAHTYFTLKHFLGFPKVKLYDGGFNEWSVREDLPVESSH